MKKCIFVVTILMVIVLGCCLTVNAVAGELKVGEKQQSRLLLGQYHSYNFYCDETQYYEFQFENQSIETRINVGFADEFLNFFVGKMTVSVYDENEKCLAAKDIKCGYTGKIFLKLNKSTKYNIYVDSTIVGNYSVSVKKLGDAGGDTMENANIISASDKICAAIDAPNDQDWYFFETDNQNSFCDVEIENISGGYKEFTLYEYVSGAGQTPLKVLKDISSYSGGKNNFNVKLEKNKKYYVQLTSSAEGGYILTLDRSIDSVGDDIDEAHKIDLNQSYVSSFDGKDDADWIKIKTSDVDAYYDISIDRLGDYAYTEIIVCDENGNEVKKSNMHCSDLNINIKLEPASVYFICFSSTVTGNYEFSVDESKDEFTDEIENAKTVKLNQAYESAFDGKNDADWMKIKTSDVDAYYNISIDRLGDYAYTEIIVCDENGNEVKKANMHCSDLNIDIKLEPASVYYICFSSTVTGNYKCQIQELADSEADTKNDAFLIVMNQKYQAGIESKEDEDWYCIELPSKTHLEIVLLNESCSRISLELYTSRDMKLETMNMYSSGEGRKNKIFEDAGIYYIKVFGSKGNYTLSLGEYGKTVPTTAGNSKETQGVVGGRILLTIGEKEANVFGKIVSNDVAPIARNGRTMLPARFVAENLGASVYWYGDEEKVVVKNNEVEIILYINSSAAFVNGEKIKLDSPAFAENGRTYTPVRFIAENLGATVDWLPDTQQVLIVK